jgi:hypothetical protein
MEFPEELFKNSKEVDWERVRKNPPNKHDPRK